MLTNIAGPYLSATTNRIIGRVSDRTDGARPPSRTLTRRAGVEQHQRTRFGTTERIGMRQFAASRPAPRRRDRRSGSEDVSSPQRLLQVVTLVPGCAGL